MKKYPNFFETLKEAQTRLLQTVVMYDGEPYQVQNILDHKTDGIFRVYMVPLGYQLPPGFNYPEEYYVHQGRTTFGEWFDKFLLTDMGKKMGVVRKQINSPHFNNFRPFPLGMCNFNGSVKFLERAPIRRSVQGMSQASVVEHSVGLGGNTQARPLSLNILSPELRDCIKGLYPSAKECLDNLKNPNIINDGVAFDRNFAFFRGPLGLIFLVHKTDAIGMLTYGDFSELRIGTEFAHLRESITALRLFTNIIVR